MLVQNVVLLDSVSVNQLDLVDLVLTFWTAWASRSPAAPACISCTTRSPPRWSASGSTGGTSGAIVERNWIHGGAYGIDVIADGASDAEIRFNRIEATATGIDLVAAASGHIAGNDVDGGTTALNLVATFTGMIENNDFRNAAVGVAYQLVNTERGNRIDHNATGVVSTVGSARQRGLGFPAGSGPNEIFANTTGVNLTGQMQQQHVLATSQAFSGSGQLVSADLDHANLIEANTTGVSFGGPIRWQRIAGNATGIVAVGGQMIDHNLIYRNTTAGVYVQGAANVRILQNTFYTPAGDNIRVTGVRQRHGDLGQHAVDRKRL